MSAYDQDIDFRVTIATDPEPASFLSVAPVRRKHDVYYPRQDKSMQYGSLDLSAHTAAMRRSFVFAVSCVLLMQVLWGVPWTATATAIWGWRTFFTWAFAALYIPRTLALLVALWEVKRPHLNASSVTASDGTSFDYVRVFGIMPMYTSLATFGGLAVWVHPIAIAALVLAQGVTAPYFGIDLYFLLNVAIMVAAGVSGLLENYFIRTVGVRWPRQRALFAERGEM